MRVYTPREFWEGELDESEAITSFLRRFRSRSPRLHSMQSATVGCCRELRLFACYLPTRASRGDEWNWCPRTRSDVGARISSRPYRRRHAAAGCVGDSLSLVPTAHLETHDAALSMQCYASAVIPSDFYTIVHKHLRPISRAHCSVRTKSSTNSSPRWRRRFYVYRRIGEELEGAALDAYRGWNRFLAEYLKHLHEEETRLLPELGARNPPASGAAALVAQHGERAAAFLTMLLPMIAHAERTVILQHSAGRPRAARPRHDGCAAMFDPAQMAELERSTQNSAHLAPRENLQTSRCYCAAIHASTQATSARLSGGRASGIGEPHGGLGESFW